MNARTDLSLLAVPESSFATIASGICVPYVECGDGEPLIFVHGSLCDYRYWDARIAALSQHFRCISVSLSHYWPASAACIQGEFGWRTHVAELAEFIGAREQSWRRCVYLEVRCAGAGHGVARNAGAGHGGLIRCTDASHDDVPSASAP